MEAKPTQYAMYMEAMPTRQMPRCIGDGDGRHRNAPADGRQHVPNVDNNSGCGSAI
jgi:hypothetical protein